MKKLISVLIAVGISFGLVTSALAQTPMPTPGARTPRINHRQREQQKRIGEGIESGRLTPAEAARLEKQEAKIQQEKKAAKADGTVTAQERAALNKNLNKESRRIYRAKHNNRGRH